MCASSSRWRKTAAHFLASMQPIAERSADDLVKRMPATAITDMMAWGPAATPVEQFDRMLRTDLSTQKLISFLAGHAGLAG